MLTALLAICVGLTHAADVIVFGDSWGVYGRRPFEDLMTRKGLTVDNRAIAGTTASMWASGGFKSSLKKAMDQNPDVKYVWLTIGGNDAIPKMMSGADVSATMAQMVTDTRGFLDEAFAAHPDVKVVQFGYDIMNWEDESVVCNVLGWQMAKTYCGLFPTTECRNKLFKNIQEQYVDKVSTYYPNHYALNLMGTLQAAGGISGASVGNPNMNEPSPAKFVDPSCIHLTEEGHEIIFEELWNEFFAPQEALRTGASASSLEVHDLQGSGGRSGAWRPGMYLGMAWEQAENTVKAMFNWTPSFLRG